MQQCWAVLVCVSLLSAAPASSAQTPPARVRVNDAEVSLPAPLEIRNGVLVAPLAPLLAAFGATAVWDSAARAITITGVSGLTTRLTVGQVRAVSADTAWELPVPPSLDAGTVWGPAAAVLRAIGAYVREDTDAGSFEAVSQVTGIAWRRDAGGLAVTISATGPLRAEGRLLKSPDRLVVDLTSAVTRLKVPEEALQGEGILRLRTAQFHARPYVTRVVFDLAHPLGFKIALRPAAVTVALAQSPAADAAAAPEPLAVPPLPEFADGPGAFHVRGAAYDGDPGIGRVTIRASQPLAFTIHQFVYPDRLAIDIAGGIFLPRRQDLEIGSDTVRNILVSQFHLKPNLTRVVVHLHHRTAYTAFTADGGRSLVVTLGDAGRRPARGAAVIIDPGHGGLDSGAVGPSGLHEAGVVLGIGRLVQQALERRGVHAALTRSDDSGVALEERPDLAQRNGGMVFVSIHTNASRDPLVAGTETYFKTPESQALAALLQQEIVQALGEPDRGVRTADFYVIVNSPMPSALVETAFITNPREEELLRDPDAQRRIAEAIARAIVKFLAAQHQAAAP